MNSHVSNSQVWTSIIRDEWKITSRGKNHYVVHYTAAIYIPRSILFSSHRIQSPLAGSSSSMTNFTSRANLFRSRTKMQAKLSHPWSEIPNIFLYSFVAGSFLSCTRLVKPFREISWMREWKVGFISRRKYFCFEENIKPYLKPFLAEFAERRSAATNFSVDKPQFHRRRNNFRKLPLSLRHFLDTRTRKPPLSTLYPVSRPTTFPIFPTDKSRVRESWNDGWTMTGAVS